MSAARAVALLVLLITATLGCGSSEDENPPAPPTPGNTPPEPTTPLAGGERKLSLPPGDHSCEGCPQTGGKCINYRLIDPDQVQRVCVIGNPCSFVTCGSKERCEIIADGLAVACNAF